MGCKKMRDTGFKKQKKKKASQLQPFHSDTEAKIRWTLAASIPVIIANQPACEATSLKTVKNLVMFIS